MSDSDSPSRPVAPPVDSGAVAAALRETPQWVVWRYEEARPGKWTKIPYQVRDCERRASSQDRTTWGTFREAVSAYENAQNACAGIGFVFSTADPFAGVDFDGCIGEGIEVDPEVWAWLERLDSYTEISPSGRGAKVIVKARHPGGGKKRGNVEMYDAARFFTITGRRLVGLSGQVEIRQAAYEALHQSVFGDAEPDSEKTNDSSASQHDRRRTGPSSGPSLSDIDLLIRARNARDGAKFGALWSGDISHYPSRSEADLALCSLLAFWTGPDPGRIDALFRQSNLYREKWNERHGEQTYGARTVAKALSERTEFYAPYEGRAANPSQGPPSAPSPSGTNGKETDKLQLIHEDPAEPDLSLLDFPLTDSGNAERLVARYGADLRYTPEGGWMVFDGVRWVRDLSGAISIAAHQRALLTLRAFQGEAKRIPDPERRDRISRFAVSSENGGRRETMVRLARSSPGVAAAQTEFDRDPWLLTVKNGTLDLRTGEIGPHARADLITKCAPVVYRPDARCPRWEAFLDEIMAGSAGLVGFLRRIVGYSLTGDISEQALFILYGTGANGKTTFLETVRTMLGDYAQAATAETFMERQSEMIRNDLARLAGARFVTAVEIKGGRRLDEELIKRVTGGDGVTARFLQKEFFEFTPVCKVFLAANHKPIIRSTDRGTWRRPRMIPFAVAIERPDRRLPEVLRGELPGILAWAVRGCREWQEQGLAEPPEVCAATDAYREEMDPLLAFIDDACLVRPESAVGAKDLYAAYTTWCGDQGDSPVNPRTFCRLLGERGLERRRSGANGSYRWHGIGLSVYGYGREGG